MDKITLEKILEERKTKNYNVLLSSLFKFDIETRHYLLAEFMLNGLIYKYDYIMSYLISTCKDLYKKNYEYLYLLNIANNKEPKYYYNEYIKKLEQKYDNLYINPKLNNDKESKILRKIKKANKIELFEKKEKILLKLEKYDDPRVYHELGLLYFNTNRNLSFIYFDKAFNLGYRQSGIIMSNSLHKNKKIDKEIEILYKSLAKDDPETTLRLYNLLLQYNKPIDNIIPYFLDGVVFEEKLNIQLIYELAKLYEEGKALEKDNFAAYILYYTCNDYKDSLDKKEKLKEILLNEYTPILDKLLDEYYIKVLEEYNKELKEKELIELERQKLKEKEEKEKQIKLELERRQEEENQRKIEELKKFYIEKKLIIDENPEETKGYKENYKAYNKKIELYKKALEHKDSEKYIFIPLMEAAADKGHTKAMMLLYHYYLGINDYLAHSYLEKAYYASNYEAKSYYERYQEKLEEENRIKEEQEKERKKQERLLKQKEEKERLKKEKEEQKLKEEIYKNETKELIDLYKNDLNLFSQLFLQAEKENEEAINIINRCFYHKNLNNKFISILETLSISNIKYAQNFLYDYYLNFLNDRGLAGLFIKQLFDSNITSLLNKILEDINIFDNIKKTSNDELYKVIIECVFNNKHNDDIIKYTEGTLYSHYEIAKNYGYDTNYEKSFNILKKLITSDNKFVQRQSSYRVAKMYETGQGTQKDILKAIEIYEMLGSNIYADKLKESYNKKIELEANEKFRIDLINKYSHPKFDEFLKLYPERGKQIMNIYMIHATKKELEKELISRNKLLNEGIPASKIYEKRNYVSGYLIDKAEEDKRKKEQEEKEKLERLKKQEEERKQKESLEKIIKIIEESNQKTEANAKKVDTIKETSNEEKVVEVKTTTTSSTNKSTVLINHIKNNCDKELFEKHKALINPDLAGNRSIYDHNIMLAKFRASYNKPIEPDKKNYSRGDYKIVYNNYREANTNYQKTIYGLENPIVNHYNAYRKRTWDLFESADIITASNFCKVCSEKFNKKGDITISLKVKRVGSYKDSENNNLFGIDILERMFAYIPMYTSSFFIDVHVYMNYEVQLGSEYNDLYDDFHNSEISKIVTWDEFSSPKSPFGGDVWQASYNDSNRQSNYNAAKDMQAKKIIEPFLKEMAKKYYIFTGYTMSDYDKNQYVEAMVKHIDYMFHFHEK